MCGIFGVIRRPSSLSSVGLDTNYRDFMANAMVTGVVRGWDGTGGFWIDRELKSSVRKAPNPGPIFFASGPQGKELCQAATRALVVVGHHRAATKGQISWATTHPFEHGGKKDYVIGVHNGHVYSYKYKEDEREFDVDSDWVMYRLWKQGVEAYKDFGGAFALVYYDRTTNSVYMSSNGDRPLSIAYVKDQDAICFASERDMLKWLMRRNKLEIGVGERKVVDKETGEEQTIKIQEIFDVGKGQLIKFDLDKPLREREVTEFPKYEIPATYYTQQHQATPEENEAWVREMQERYGERVSANERNGNTARLTPPESSRSSLTTSVNCSLNDLALAAQMGLHGVWGKYTPTGFNTQRDCAEGHFEIDGVDGVKFIAEIRGLASGDMKAWRRSHMKGCQLLTKIQGISIEMHKLEKRTDYVAIAHLEKPLIVAADSGQGVH